MKRTVAIWYAGMTSAALMFATAHAQTNANPPKTDPTQSNELQVGQGAAKTPLRGAQFYQLPSCEIVTGYQLFDFALKNNHSPAKIVAITGAKPIIPNVVQLDPESDYRVGNGRTRTGIEIVMYSELNRLTLQESLGRIGMNETEGRMQ